MSDPRELLRYLRNFPKVEGNAILPHYLLDREGWQGMLEIIAVTDWTFLGLWGEKETIHLALRDEENVTTIIVSLNCPERSYPAVSPLRPGAIRMERATFDLLGLIPEGAEDGRPWLDHGSWPYRHPLAREDHRKPSEPVVYSFLPVESPTEKLHQIPVGPVHAGIIEPGHFRFHANGETVVRLEQWLGYVHKGVEGLMEGRSLEEAGRICARISGDATVAYSLAFARAAESALGIEAPPRAVWLRAIMAELERVANHLGDIGAICNDAAFAFMQAHCTLLKETVLRTADFCFGHRLMMDRICVGGVTTDLSDAAEHRLSALLRYLRPRFAELMAIYDDTPSLLDRTVGTGVTSASLIWRYGCGGHVARAASRGVDARRVPGYAPYEELEFEVPVYADGDVHSRLLVRADEIKESLKLIETMLSRLPLGPIAEPFMIGESGEGLAFAESFRGEVMVWLKLDENGKVLRCYPRDPSWFQWPLLEMAIENNIVADFPLCNKSFNCSYSGHDL
jgi:Ni,Fe-hydrogenase III large subunit